MYAERQMQMQPASASDKRDLDRTEIPDDLGNTIKKNRAYKLQVDLPQRGYFLLINQGVSGRKYGLCPSRAYYPDGNLLGISPIVLPHVKGLAKSLSYTTPGKEYFLAVVTEEPLSLSWFKPDSDPRDILINESRLSEIFQQVGEQKSSVFYATFQGIDKG